MTITLELPEEALAALRAEAAALGRAPEALAAERLASWYEPDPLFAAEGSAAEAEAVASALEEVAQGRTKPFDPDAILRRYGVPTLASQQNGHPER